MRLMLFIKIFLVLFSASLLYFGLWPEVTFIELIKLIAVGMAISILTSIVYPEIRGIKTGDLVAVVNNSIVPIVIGKSGIALEQGKRNTKIRVQLSDGSEGLGIIESYEGIVSPPKIKILYEEKLNAR
ncbi:MAG TPA: hypothetical protein VI912_02585 [Candidatus Bilamarchaeaceae archaeon]|nr:hypothetical protein [Candidatus Bilamarchaeaceae archaeon]